MALLDILTAYPYAYYVFLFLAFLGLCTLLYLLCSVIWWIISHTSKKSSAPVDHMQTKRIKELETQVASLKKLETELEEIRAHVQGAGSNK